MRLHRPLDLDLPACPVCGDQYPTRAYLARHRLAADHYLDNETETEQAP